MTFRKFVKALLARILICDKVKVWRCQNKRICWMFNNAYLPSQLRFCEKALLTVESFDKGWMKIIPFESQNNDIINLQFSFSATHGSKKTFLFLLKRSKQLGDIGNKTRFWSTLLTTADAIESRSSIKRWSICSVGWLG